MPTIDTIVGEVWIDVSQYLDIISILVENGYAVMNYIDVERQQANIRIIERRYE